MFRKLIKSIFFWHFKSMQPKSALDVKWALDPLKSKYFRPSGKRFYMIRGHYYTYDSPTKRHFFRYLFLGIFLLSFFLWFAVESFKGWDLFQP